VPRVPFPGYPAFLESAARQIGRPEAEAPARRIATLSALANLCAQASLGGPEVAPAVLAKAAEFRDQLHAAALAADLMIAEVFDSLGLGNPDAGSLSTGSTRGRRRPVPPRPLDETA